MNKQIAFSECGGLRIVCQVDSLSRVLLIKLLLSCYEATLNPEVL